MNLFFEINQQKPATTTTIQLSSSHPTNTTPPAPQIHTYKHSHTHTHIYINRQHLNVKSRTPSFVQKWLHYVNLVYTRNNTTHTDT